MNAGFTQVSKTWSVALLSNYVLDVASQIEATGSIGRICYILCKV